MQNERRLSFMGDSVYDVPFGSQKAQKHTFQTKSKN